MATKKTTQAEQQTGLKARIRASGLKFTGPRAAVLRVMESATTPLTHADVVDAVTGDGIESPTVYRNLMDLFEAGLLHRLDLGDHTWRYELRTQGDEHPHFVCQDCGVVECLPEESVTLKTTRAVARVGSIHEILLKGRCAACA
jgi:Fur family ferric uptake transcriptional regulator